MREQVRKLAGRGVEIQKPQSNPQVGRASEKGVLKEEGLERRRVRLEVAGSQMVDTYTGCSKLSGSVCGFKVLWMNIWRKCKAF